jgi:hypothetical protein
LKVHQFAEMSESLKAEVRRLHFEEAMSAPAIRTKLNLTKGQVSGLIFRMNRGTVNGHVKAKGVPRRHSLVWDETNLTEPWSEYAARKRAERQALRVQAAQAQAGSSQGGRYGHA